MKLTLTLDLQEDNNTSVLKGVQTLPNFSATDFETVVTFLVGDKLRGLVRLQGWEASGTLPKHPNGTVVTINQL
jgi:hypothetical protein